MSDMMDPVHAMRPGVLQLNALPPLSLYVHLPWCIKKCPYCDFNSHEFRTGADAPSTQDAYIGALFADLEASLPLIWGRSIQTVFLGGGTPSLFSPEAIDRLVSGIRARVAALLEFTGLSAAGNENEQSEERLPLSVTGDLSVAIAVAYSSVGRS